LKRIRKPPLFSGGPFRRVFVLGGFVQVSCHPHLVPFVFAIGLPFPLRAFFSPIHVCPCSCSRCPTRVGVAAGCASPTGPRFFLSSPPRRVTVGLKGFFLHGWGLRFLLCVFSREERPILQESSYYLLFPLLATFSLDTDWTSPPTAPHLFFVFAEPLFDLRFF